MIRGRKATDSRCVVLDRRTSAHLDPELRGFQHRTCVNAVDPDAQAHAPFLEAGTEVLRSVDGIEHREDASHHARRVEEGFFAHHCDAREGSFEVAEDLRLQEEVSIGLWAPVWLEPHGRSASDHFGEKAVDKATHAFKRTPGT